MERMNCSSIKKTNNMCMTISMQAMTTTTVSITMINRLCLLEINNTATSMEVLFKVTCQIPQILQTSQRNSISTNSLTMISYGQRECISQMSQES